MKEDDLNVYGDKRIIISKGRGADISSQRFDYLDQAATRYAATSDPNGIFLDLGCGTAIQSFRFAILGHQTIAVDTHDFSNSVGEFKKIFSINNLLFWQSKIEDLTFDDQEINIQCIFSQRTLHYLKYSDAFAFISKIKKSFIKGGRLFLSASGLNSELGNGYAAVNEPLATRFSVLSTEMQEKHGIYSPVCLYREEDMISLCLRNGFRCVDISSSQFGNIKGIFEH